ncbi:MAG: PspA/IM30 family protein [Candidatus Wallbacteria bacterium]|nr:PspA/IM30 family protein [Candidatus Wallbacteria bacterium]
MRDWVKEQVAQAMVEERRAQKKLAEYKEEAASWKSKAQFAVTKGDDALAKAALVRYKSSQDLVVQCEKDRERQSQGVETLKQALTAMEAKIEDAKRQKKTLITRKHIAETKMKLSTTVDSVKETDAFAEFDRIANKIEDMELKSGVMLELSGGDAVKAEVKLLEGASEVDIELAKLKAEMGVDKGGGQ